eukprot:403357164
MNFNDPFQEDISYSQNVDEISHQQTNLPTDQMMFDDVSSHVLKRPAPIQSSKVQQIYNNKQTINTQLNFKQANKKDPIQPQKFNQINQQLKLKQSNQGQRVVKASDFLQMQKLQNKETKSQKGQKVLQKKRDSIFKNDKEYQPEDSISVDIFSKEWKNEKKIYQQNFQKNINNQKLNNHNFGNFEQKNQRNTQNKLNDASQMYQDESLFSDNIFDEEIDSQSY